MSSFFSPSVNLQKDKIQQGKNGTVSLKTGCTVGPNITHNNNALESDLNTPLHSTYIWRLHYSRQNTIRHWPLNKISFKISIEPKIHNLKTYTYAMVKHLKMSTFFSPSVNRQSGTNTTRQKWDVPGENGTPVLRGTTP